MYQIYREKYIYYDEYTFLVFRKRKSFVLQTEKKVGNEIKQNCFTK